MALLDAAYAGSFSGTGPYSLAGVAVANNANRVLFIEVLLGDITKDVTSVTRDGQSATQIFNGAASGDVRLQIWRIIAPNVSTAPVVVSVTGNSDQAYVAARSVYNANQTTPNGAVVTSTSAAMPITLNPTAGSASDLVLDLWGISAGAKITAVTPGSGQTQDFLNVGGTYRSIFGSHKSAGAAGAVPMSVSEAIASINFSLYAAYAVNDAGTGTGAGAGATVNLVAASSTETPTSSTGAATVTPAMAGTVNLIAANSIETPTSGTGAATVTPVTTATVTSDVFKGFGGLALANLTVPNVMLIKLDRTVALSLANQVTNASGQLVIPSSALVSGTDYMLVTFNADGTVRGCKKVTAV